jgi:hypothetical protein
MYCTPGKSISILEWGMSLEMKPKADLLYLLAGACGDGGRWDAYIHDDDDDVYLNRS